MASINPFEQLQGLQMFTPQRRRFVSTEDGEITWIDANGMNPGRLPSLFSNEAPNQRVEDMTSKILDGVSRISISTESWPTTSSASTITSPIDASDTAAEVSFTEDEDANHDVLTSDDASTMECLPSTLVVCTLTPSPIRPTGRNKRKGPLVMTTPVREITSPCMTPRTCNILRGPRPKKRRPCFSIPNSPIVNANVLSSHVAHGPLGFTSPFAHCDHRLDRFAVDQDVAALKSSSNDIMLTAAVENPFLYEQRPSGDPSLPMLARRFRRRRDRLLSIRAKPFPYVPTLTPKL